MSAPKRKPSVYLDAELERELRRIEGSLSEQVNKAVREMLAKRRRQCILNQFLDELSARHGQVPADLVKKYEKLLG